jgi:hypothetical protein
MNHNFGRLDSLETLAWRFRRAATVQRSGGHDRERPPRPCSSTATSQPGVLRRHHQDLNLNGGYRHGQNITLSGATCQLHQPPGGFATDLVGLRFNWSFTPKSYLQAFTQYNTPPTRWGLTSVSPCSPPPARASTSSTTPTCSLSYLDLHKSSGAPRPRVVLQVQLPVYSAAARNALRTSPGSRSRGSRPPRGVRFSRHLPCEAFVVDDNVASPSCGSR